MERRTLLGGLSSAVIAGLAGCLGAGSEPASEEPTESPGDPTVTDSPPTSPSPTPGGTVVDTGFTVTHTANGQAVDEATVAFGDPVVVTGTIWGNDGCQTAELTGAALADGTLTVVVRETTRKSTETQACTEAIVEVDYEATVAVDGSGPSTVVVVHEHGDERVEAARAER